MSNLYCQLALFSQPNAQQVSRKHLTRWRWRAEDAVIPYSLLAQFYDEEGDSIASKVLLDHVKMRYPISTKVSQVERSR